MNTVVILLNKFSCYIGKLKIYKNIIYYCVKVIYSVLFALLLTNTFGNWTLFGVNKYEVKQFTSMKDFRIYNATLINQNTILSLTNDSQIVIGNIKNSIKNVLIEINETSETNFLMQIFYDTGNGFNEIESSKIMGKCGNNLIKLNTSEQINNIRIDLTNLTNHQLTIGKIVLNQFASLRKLSLIFILNVAFLLFINIYYLDSSSKMYTIATMFFYTIVLYITDTFLINNIHPYYNILFFIILCLLLFITKRIWKEINKK